MADKIEAYERQLAEHRDSRLFLLQNSGLPGPRGNIELARAFANTAGQHLIYKYASITEAEAPVGTREEFLSFCGTLGLGRLAVEGKKRAVTRLRKAASDGWWRVREAVAMALQRIGSNDMRVLLDLAKAWSGGSYYEQRAAIAGVCEPDLLKNTEHAEPVFGILDSVTESVHIAEQTSRKSEEFRVLRNGLGYCWSVAVAAYPESGKPAFEAWLDSGDRDIRWILKENLKRKRLGKMDPAWVERMQNELA